MKVSCITFIFFLSFFSAFPQMNITIDGSLNFDSSTLSITEAGLDYSEDEKLTSTILLSFENSDDNDKSKYNWTLKISKTGDAVLVAKRTGPGSNANNQGSVKIYEGLDELTLTETETEFFHGNGEIVDVPVTISVSSSVTMGMGTTGADVVFTLYER